MKHLTIKALLCIYKFSALNTFGCKCIFWMTFIPIEVMHEIKRYELMFNTNLSSDRQVDLFKWR